MKGLLPDAVRRRFDPAERYGLRLTLFALAVVLVAVPFGLLLDQVVRGGPLIEVDQGVANAVHRWARGLGDVPLALVRFVTDLGAPPVLVAWSAIATVYVLRHRRARLAAFLVATGTLGGLVNSTVKVLVDRPRPVFDHPLGHAMGKSFPSGHAMSSTVVYGALLLVFLPALPRRARPYAVGGVVTLVLLIAASRLALGVHYLSDVLGGVVLGLAWLAASVAAFRVWVTERGRPATPVLAGVEPDAAADLAPGSH